MKKNASTFLLILLAILMISCQSEREVNLLTPANSENENFTEFFNGYHNCTEVVNKKSLYADAGAYVFNTKSNVSEESLLKIAKNLYFILGTYEPNIKESILLKGEDEILLLNLMDYLKEEY